LQPQQTESSIVRDLLNIVRMAKLKLSKLLFQ